MHDYRMNMIDPEKARAIVKKIDGDSSDTAFILTGLAIAGLFLAALTLVITKGQ